MFPKSSKLRNNKGWSQAQLAIKIEADLQRVSKYEREVMGPTMEIMVRIAEAFWFQPQKLW
ncbi:MAG: helix-turn-helix transcriptional regulator [Desulfobacteraceae bacterium]|nr:helix-turn-helix transcriptional regulator [Desulfobacteraceae bacterium]MBC2755754.1 helix-turn-helix transcriptional regulator [Desulfobacteraceae bacterium]